MTEERGRAVSTELYSHEGQSDPPASLFLPLTLVFQYNVLVWRFIELCQGIVAKLCGMVGLFLDNCYRTGYYDLIYQHWRLRAHFDIYAEVATIPHLSIWRLSTSIQSAKFPWNQSQVILFGRCLAIHVWAVVENFFHLHLHCRSPNCKNVSQGWAFFFRV